MVGVALFKQGDKDNFSFYLLDGEIELHANDQQQNVISSGSERALYAMAQLQPRQFSAKAKTEAVVFQIQRDVLDRQMVLQEEDDPVSDGGIDVDSGSGDMEVSHLDDEEDVDWMTRMLQSELFARLPTANIGQLFALLEEVNYHTGDIVIKQGDPGDKYYIIQAGSCNVLRTPPSGGKDLKLATLGAGDSFGEEALVSDSIRNATIQMASDGILMELSKENFTELIQNPSLQSVSYEQALSFIDEGAEWLDVRFKKEHESHAIPGSTNIPLNMLRMQVQKLDIDKKYIVYCDTGGRSSTGAFLLAERAFDVWYLEGGIVNNPELADKSEVTQVPAQPVKQAPAPAPEPAAAPEPAPAPTPVAEEKPAAPAAAAEPAPAPQEAAPEAAATETDLVEEISKQDMDPGVKASVLEAELNRTNMQLEEVEKAKKQADESVKAAQQKVEAQLQEERAKIELAKKEAEAEAQKLRQQEEAKVQQMKAEAEKRLQEEKARMEEGYSQNAAEMEKIEKMKQEAEAQVAAEKARLAEAAEAARKELEEAEALKKQMEAAREQELEAARKEKQEAEEMKKELEAARKQEAEDAERKLEEARRLKEEVEASRKAMEEAAEKRRLDQEAMEKQIQEAAQAKLEEERRKLSEEFARNNAEIEKAKREKAEAEAARLAAKEEAEKVIAEYKVTKDQSLADEEARLRAERMKLEEEQQKIKETLLQVQKTKEEAELAKKAALAEVAALKTKLADEVADDKADIDQEIKNAEEKVTKAAKEIVQAQQAQVKAVAAKNINAVDLQKKKEKEEELRRQLEADLSDFKRERDVEEAAYDSTTILEKMKRIKESAEAAKKDEQDKNNNLLDDIAAQLGGD